MKIEQELKNKALSNGKLVLLIDAVKIANDFAKEQSIDFLDSIRGYEHESGNRISLDERSSEELYTHYLTLQKEKDQIPKKQDIIDTINNMSHYEMCELWRHAPLGHIYFDNTLPYHKLFKQRLFVHFGGFTTEISKNIGWDKK